MDASLAAVYTATTIEECLKNKKSMWGGSFQHSDHMEYLPIESKMVATNCSYPDSMYKNIDELAVNVIDAHVKSGVTKCRITYSPDGYFSIYNDGEGFPVGLVPGLDGKLVYVPQLVSTVFLAGSNNKEDPDRITGGVNGIGLTMVNANSTYFSLETVDTTRKLHFKQECLNRLETIGVPVVTPVLSLPKKHILLKGGTIITILPDYSAYEIKLDREYPLLLSLVKARAYQMAAHVKMKMWVNDEPILDTKTPFVDYSKMFTPDIIFTTAVGPKYTWKVALGLTANNTMESISIINGVNVKSGDHITRVKDQVVAGLQVRVERLLKNLGGYKKNAIVSNLFIIISGSIPNPGFDSQTKTSLTGVFKDYVIPASGLTKYWGMLEPRLLQQYQTTIDKVPKRKAKTDDIDKYVKARFAGTAKAMDCSLLIAEGDSAASMTATALSDSSVELTGDYFGVFNIGGVPMNSRRQTAVKVAADKTIFLRNKRLTDNERLSSLSKVLNLSHTMQYENEEEFKTLYYGTVVVTVDQDHDGIGQIMGLLLSHFALFWPALINRGYIKHFATPIIRIYPKGNGDVLSFYTDREYRAWKEAKFVGEPTGCIVNYYKGLATHSDAEAVDMFRRYKESLYTITLDMKAAETFHTFYGDDADLRKIELAMTRAPVYATDNKISCTDHLQTHTKLYQLDNILRKLPNIFDGIPVSRRKVLAASRNIFANGNKEMKVFQMAATAASSMNYHHGVQSMEDTIIGMVQDFVGANNAPMFLRVSQFGSRDEGPSKSGAPRYVKTKLNKPLFTALFRVEDTYVLDYTFDEGVRNEPVNYMPIAPYILMESIEIPASGWKYAGFARDWRSLYENIKLLIAGGSAKPMPFWNRKWRGEIVEKKVGGTIQIWNIGTYTGPVKNIVTITELPYRVWTVPFVKAVEAMPDVISVNNKSTNSNILIHIKMKPGVEFKGSDSFDGVIEYFGLKKRMSRCLNVVHGDVVRECKTYIEILHIWFEARKQMYTKRFNRLAAHTKLLIHYHKEIARYVNNYNHDYGSMDIVQAEQCLIDAKFKKMNSSIVLNPEYLGPEEIENHAYNNGASFSYLLNIGPMHRLESARNTRAAKIQKLEDYLAEITGAGIVNKTWLVELEELNEAIVASDGPRGWLYSESKVRFV
jgi:DNA topoisomerase-2